ncbi:MULTISPECIES: Gfo/Idh/MocA family oxidoreductase [unclassified Bradyrhizobium]|uniref:Gfo/Idh/MocA family protein n=1 Tax=unclassified Bradyrhizobium TaxID=2631580 RepID=UPI003392B3C0
MRAAAKLLPKNPDALLSALFEETQNGEQQMITAPAMYSSPVRVAVAGCGAVSRLYYAPALRRLQAAGRLHVEAVFDPDLKAAGIFAKNFTGPRKVSSYGDLLGKSTELIILASPPEFHPQQAIDALESGIAVHCEKPLAMSAKDGQLMVETAARCNRLLSVGLMRRRFAATRSIRELLNSKFLGDVTSIDIFEGGPFDWPVASPEYFTRHQSGGGVLLDIGTHVLDLLRWWFGEPLSAVYEDDSMGGVEVNCRIVLRFRNFDANIRLSRDWARPNRYFIRATKGWLTWTANEARSFAVGLHGASSAAEVLLYHPTNQGIEPALGSAGRDFEFAFDSQLEATIAALTGQAEIVSGADALATLKLIEGCYATRVPMSAGWML